jgi:hypothetical protein
MSKFFKCPNNYRGLCANVANNFSFQHIKPTCLNNKQTSVFIWTVEYKWSAQIFFKKIKGFPSIYPEGLN